MRYASDKIRPCLEQVVFSTRINFQSWTWNYGTTGAVPLFLHAHCTCTAVIRTSNPREIFFAWITEPGKVKQKWLLRPTQGLDLRFCFNTRGWSVISVFVSSDRPTAPHKKELATQITDISLLITVTRMPQFVCTTYAYTMVSIDTTLVEYVIYVWYMYVTFKCTGVNRIRQYCYWTGLRSPTIFWKVHGCPIGILLAVIVIQGRMCTIPV